MFGKLYKYNYVNRKTGIISSNSYIRGEVLEQKIVVLSPILCRSPRLCNAKTPNNRDSEIVCIWHSHLIRANEKLR